MNGLKALKTDSVQVFLQHFGVSADPVNEPEQFLKALKQLDPRFQGGRNLVRYELEADSTKWSEEAKHIIMDCAVVMRMRDPETPLAGDYDLVIALGGARHTNRDRADYAADSHFRGWADFQRLVVAGTNRKIREIERAITNQFTDYDAKTEYDLCVDAVEFMNEKYEEVLFESEAFLLEDENAGTPDVIEAVIAEIFKRGELSAISSVATVTTQIYWLSTVLDTDRVARKFGITRTFTAGHPSADETVFKRTPATYLSEILRTLRAATLAAQAEV